MTISSDSQDAGILFYTSLFLVFSLEHLFYSFIWYQPLLAQRLFSLICGASKDPCVAVHYGLVCNKTLQAILSVYLLYTFDLQLAVLDASLTYKVSYWMVLVHATLFLVGQILNFSVYNAIGFDGVYYGVKFNKTIPWVTKFPYNVKWLKHPQYAGTWLSYINGIFILKLIMVPNEALSTLLSNLQIFITLSYLYMSFIEST
eukprot:CAMPEP_0202686046 /NCGR_PEP_ID=MMETSP1385-20130828/1841_1 /ASSEMBLY_ACC=CAM_ASM_000861 /TAXON_ID=933848 /ORGANISM="Elphidium margaritaceum" /LENGTH=201 /DNA_ID=CAMNT_0049340545 /DNA_START=32 /DNA_END=637 /DNA_ORIENTATION=-